MKPKKELLWGLWAQRKTNLFARKKIGINRKTNLQKHKQTHSLSFGKLCGHSPKKHSFLVSFGKVGFGLKNQLFPNKKTVLVWKTNFLLAKKRFFSGNPTPPRKNWVLVWKTNCNFFLAKGWFWARKPSFS